MILMTKPLFAEWHTNMHKSKYNLCQRKKKTFLKPIKIKAYTQGLHDDNNYFIDFKRKVNTIQ